MWGLFVLGAVLVEVRGVCVCICRYAWNFHTDDVKNFLINRVYRSDLYIIANTIN